jgi:hypothetical protein
MFTTKAASTTTDKGKFEFYVDDVLVSSLVDSGITIKDSGTLAIGSSAILNDVSGTTTLCNIDALDMITRNTIKQYTKQYIYDGLTQANNTNTLTVNTLYSVTAASSAFAVNIPSGATTCDIIDIMDGSGVLTTNNLTINRTGSDTFSIGDISVTSFIMNRNYMRIRLEKVNSTVWSINVFTQSGVWKDYTMTIGSTTTPPTKQNVITDRAQYCVIGKTLCIRYDYRQNAASLILGSGTYLFPLPSGYSTNLTSGTSDDFFVVGNGYVQRTLSSTAVQVEMYNGTNMRLRTASGSLVTALLFSLGSDQSYTFTATIPIN